MSRDTKEVESTSIVHKAMTVVGIILCVILAPILVMNLVLLIKGYSSDEVPSIGGHMPLIVLTDSMFPEIQSGDLIICKTVQPDEVQVGDVIAFFDPAGSGTTVVSHRVTKVYQENGMLCWNTKGDNNNTEDSLPVTQEDLVGVYTGIRIQGAGDVAMFMQTTQGLVVCVVVPLVALIAYDVIRRRIYEKRHQVDAEALRQELEELRAYKAQRDAVTTQRKDGES